MRAWLRDRRQARPSSHQAAVNVSARAPAGNSEQATHELKESRPCRFRFHFYQHIESANTAAMTFYGGAEKQYRAKIRE